MLNKDPDRHIRLMPAQFEYTGQFSAIPSQFSNTQQKLDVSKPISCDRSEFKQPYKLSADFGGGIEEFFEQKVSQNVTFDDKDKLHNLLPRRGRA